MLKCENECCKVRIRALSISITEHRYPQAFTMVNTDMKFRKNSDPGYLGKCNNSTLTMLCQCQRISFEIRNRDLTQRPIREAMPRKKEHLMKKPESRIHGLLPFLQLLFTAWRQRPFWPKDRVISGSQFFHL